MMADPGKDFRATDVIYDSSLPSKRLIFAGVSGDKCFVHYEQGGIGLSYVLALFKVTSKDHIKPIWRGYCGRRATNLEGLRSLLAGGNCSGREHSASSLAAKAEIVSTVLTARLKRLRKNVVFTCCHSPQRVSALRSCLHRLFDFGTGVFF